MARALMFQGTGSDVGKTVLVAGLCRLARHKGLRVRPFKPQNMSNNAAVASGGGEIGRGQWLQAFACGVEPCVDMNPVLLKPQSENGAQVIVQGKVYGNAKGYEYQDMKGKLLPYVMKSFERVKSKADIVLVEGAGSPAETNLRKNDVANMGFAEKADIPVVLIGDIDRGGVIASLVGTHTILDSCDRERIAGYLINKFRGDPSLFDDGLKEIEKYTGWPSYGVVPWIEAMSRLPAEDSVGLFKVRGASTGRIKIAVPVLPHIANFDDFDPLIQEKDVDLVFVRVGEPIAYDCHAVIIPGSKATIADMETVQNQSWTDDIRRCYENGAEIIGICGGFQMLGRIIDDPDGIEGRTRRINGLGLLDIVTALKPEKITRNIMAHSYRDHTDLQGYEIHLGESAGPDCDNAFLEIDGRKEGAASSDGRVWGTYLHGLFNNGTFRQKFLKRLGGFSSGCNQHDIIDQALDDIANALAQAIDIDALFALAR